MIYTPEPKVYLCSHCQKWWKPGNTSCAVLHQGSGCCHYGDEEVPALEEEIDFGGREVEHSDFYERD